MVTYVYVYLPKLCIKFSVLFMDYWEILARNQSKEKFARCIPIYRLNVAFI